MRTAAVYDDVNPEAQALTDTCTSHRIWSQVRRHGVTAQRALDEVTEPVTHQSRQFRHGARTAICRGLHVYCRLAIPMAGFR